ncbi:MULTISPECIES: hypothetical protein [Croceitalea]|uniref:Leishmanolysin n=1 Tax=Croceitalea vernalis TaxID=3075599 RepID=A0ABU3BH99_9FLAO|nr:MULTISPECIES: hypothetical protein [unclassified Croceitalea]MDT0539726.1 hypothetical protein [Croceitalea sp. P059]MDT0621540.1 hypothetical protein [Croceitalea sp. P007]
MKKRNLRNVVLKRSMAFGTLLGVIFLTSCSDEVIEENPSTLSETQLKTLTLVPDPVQPIELKDLSDNDPEVLKGRATDAAGVDRGRFNITLNFVVPVTDRQRQVFEDAAARWERIIIGDVPSFTGTIPSAFIGLPPASEGVLDDIVIEVALTPIDGPGSILGSAGPRFVRTDDFLTLAGLMRFDVDDLAFLDELDLFEEVIVHEMGHVLGVGTLWNTTQFGFDRTLLEGTIEEPYFSGSKANVFWNAEGGSGELPIQGLVNGEIRPGTSFGHWDEATLNNELMTGFLNLGENPLSRITAGSMRDLGYRSASVGESYDLPEGAAGVDINEAAANGAGIKIAEMEELLMPIGFVTSSKK